MHLLIFVCFLIAPIAFAALPRSCPGGYPLGTTQERGIYWYRCSERGILTKEGCLDPQRQRIPIGATYTQNDYVMRCEVLDDYLRIMPYACSSDGREILPGDTWQDEKFWYTCEKRDGNVFITVTGCMLGDDRLSVNQRKQKGDLVYECSKKQYGATALCSVGCVFNGREYLLGQSYQDEHFKYSCTQEGGWCHSAVVGCIDEYGAVHNNGQTWQTGDGHYRCSAKIEDTADKAEVIIEGCLDKQNPGSIRRVGESWLEGDTRFECRISNRRALRYISGYRK